MKIQETQKSKNNLEKEQSWETHMLHSKNTPDFKFYYKAIVTKTV